MTLVKCVPITYFDPVHKLCSDENGFQPLQKQVCKKQYTAGYLDVAAHQHTESKG